MLLNNLLSQKATQSREEAATFESSLASEFRTLEAKSGENLNKINEQVDLVSEQEKLENDIANRVAKISAMFTKNALLEGLVYAKINSKLDQFPKKTEEDEVKISPPPTTKPEDNKENKKPKLPRLSIPFLSQKKLSEGGVVPPTGYEKSNKFTSKSLPYADVLALTLKASGISSVARLGEFVKATESLGGFFAPYVKSLVNPFALALGVNQNIINTLLGGAVQAATLNSRDQQRYFGKTWGKFLNDPDFVDKFIDREMDPDDPSKPRGYVPANWKDDPAFTAELNRVAQKFNINANDLLAVMLVETGGSLRPDIRNSKSGATGLIQFMPATARGLGTTTDELARMSRAEQMKYVEKYLDGKLPQGASGGQIYAAVFLPAFINKEVLTVRGEAYYNANEGLDYNRDNKITRTDLNDHVEAMKKRYKLQRGDSVGNLITPMSPYIMTGPEAGYNVNIQGYDVTLHGEEVIVPFGGGFQVYPIQNRRYDITEDPIGVAKRWKEIAHGSNAKMSSFSSGGSAEFWQMAAITAREDTLHPQGQADVAQSLYNRMAIGSYPGGKNLLGIITAPDQFQPTFKNRGAWLAIRDRDSAIAAAGNQKIVDMAANSITNPSLQKEAARFVGGRTDFQGESQKKYMKPDDITRGKDHNFFGWFYDARLAKPAAIPKMISSQTKVTATADKSKPKIIINRANQSSQPNIIQQAQSAVVTFTNMIFNPHRVKRELNMKHVR